MTRTRWAAGMAVVLISLPLLAEAGPISRACMDSGRKGASSSLCACLDRVAKGELSRRDQRKAAKFFKDPQRAQDTRQSDRPSDEAFWKRYRSYSTRAADICS